MCKMNEQDSTNLLLELKCKSGHNFDSVARKIAIAMFNMFAKNLISEENSEIHKNRKRNKDDDNAEEEEVKRDPSKIMNMSTMRAITEILLRIQILAILKTGRRCY